ncbi:hypothetical protein BDW22DRAFT_1356779 [Trametopsis cervina]|nr:hypothetical protein BDW22DRAFT_1356779 [Trametopsis cervina]
MLTAYELLTFPATTLCTILAIFFRFARPIIRYTFTLTVPQETPVHTLSYSSVSEFATLRLDPPSSSIRHIPRHWSGSGTLPSYPHQEKHAPPYQGLVLTFAFGMLVMLASVLFLRFRLCFTAREESKLGDVAQLYTDITGRPYVQPPWELVSLSEVPDLEPSPCLSDVELNLYFCHDISFELSLDDTVEDISALFYEASPPHASEFLDVHGPIYAHLVNNKSVDDYLKMLTDAGYSDFSYQALDIKNSDPKKTTIEWEFTARSPAFDVFMVSTVRIGSPGDVPLTRTDFLLWDMGGGVYKAVEVLELAVQTRENVEECAGEEQDLFIHSDDSFASSDDLSGHSSTLHDLSVAGDDRDGVFGSVPVFTFGGSNASRKHGFTFGLGTRDIFDESRSETSTNSDPCEDLTGNHSLDPDEVLEGLYLPGGGIA